MTGKAKQSRLYDQAEKNTSEDIFPGDEYAESKFAKPTKRKK